MPLVLEVAIGLVFVYLVLSVLCSAIAEALEHYFRYRADYLRTGIEKLLMGDSEVWRQKLYDHALIKSLYASSAAKNENQRKKKNTDGPSYIPSRQFALALLDVVAPAAGRGMSPPAGSQVEELRAAIESNKEIPAQLTQALHTFISDAGDDMEKLKSNVQQWFDGSMDRVAGWYKRRAQRVLLVVGSLVAIGVNADTLSIVDTLSNDPTIRAAVVAAAEKQAQTPPPARAAQASENREVVTASMQQGASGSGDAAAQEKKGETPAPAGGFEPERELAATMRTSVETVTRQLGGLGLPVGWRHLDESPGGPDDGFSAKPDVEKTRYRLENRILPGSFGDVWPHVYTHFLGWLLTAIAISFGAPFWFDTLNKIMVIRSTVKPREKSGEEGSEDRLQTGKGAPVRIEVVPVK